MKLNDRDMPPTWWPRPSTWPSQGPRRGRQGDRGDGRGGRRTAPAGGLGGLPGFLAGNDNGEMINDKRRHVFIFAFIICHLSFPTEGSGRR